MSARLPPMALASAFRLRSRSAETSVTTRVRSSTTAINVFSTRAGATPMSSDASSAMPAPEPRKSYACSWNGTAACSSVRAAGVPILASAFDLFARMDSQPSPHTRAVDFWIQAPQIAVGRREPDMTRQKIRPELNRSPEVVDRLLVLALQALAVGEMHQVVIHRIRIQRHSLDRNLHAFLGLAGIDQDVREKQVAIGVIGIDGDGPPAFGDRVVILPAP